MNFKLIKSDTNEQFDVSGDTIEIAIAEAHEVVANLYHLGTESGSPLIIKQFPGIGGPAHVFLVHDTASDNDVVGRYTLCPSFGGRVILKEKPYSDHPGDAYLSVVLCDYNGKFVTWTRNHEDKGFHSGHYFEKLEDAEKDFEKRPN